MSVRGSQYVEARKVIELLRNVLNQSRVAENRPFNWELLFKTADYHNVANILYYALLRLRQDVPQEWMARFSQKYRRAVVLEEQYKNVVEAVLWNCEEEGIHALALDEYILRGYYPMPEMRALSSVEILVEKKCRPDIDRMMHHMDFIPVVGEYSYTRSGVELRFLESYPFKDRKLAKKAGKSLGFLPRAEGGRYVHAFKEPALFVFLMCCKAQRFALEEFDIRDMLDIWLFYRAEERGKSWTSIMKKLKKLRLWDFTDRMLTLAGSWFGGIEIERDEELFGDLEAFIFTKGAVGRTSAMAVLPLFRKMIKLREKEERKKERGSLAKWIFPGRDYMQILYPRMGKYRILLPVCWVRRLTRSLFSIVKQKLFKRKKEESLP